MSKQFVAFLLAVISLAVINGFTALNAHARVSSTGSPGIQLPERAQFERQRLLFLDAEKAILAKQTRQAQKLMKQLSNYPLLPYLEYLQLSRSIRKTKERDIITYLDTYPNTRLADRLRSAWLKHMASRKQWTNFLRHYTASSSTTLQCHHRTALLAKKRYKEAFQDIQTLWLIGRSQDSACDPVFEAWQKKGDFQPSLYWKRAQLALKARQFSLATYLTRQSADKKDDEYVKSWKQLYQHPNRLLTRTYPTRTPFERKLLYMGLERLLRQDEAQFKRAWQRYHQALPRSDTDFLTFSHFVARWFSWHYDPQSEYWLTLADKDLKDYELMQRRIRLALHQRDWAAVRNWIGALPIDQRQEQAWQYWDARAHLELLKQHALYLLTLDLQQPSPATANSKLVNEFTKIHNQFVHILRSPQAQLDVNWQHDSPTHALQTIRQQLLTLAKNRSFYGFLASEILKQPLSLNHTPITLNAKERAKLESQPGIQAAHEWFQLERYATARREWSYATRDFSPSEKTFAAKVANEWGWYNQGIFTAAFSNHKDDLVVRFPLGFFDTIYEQAIEQHLYADWTFALIRQESAYMHDARSPVGALGLMQLMPSTAKTVFRRYGEKYPGNRNILTPATNVKTGMRYLATLFKQFNGNLLLATAAYNAGPHRAISWQDETAGIPGDLWIELIPIQETRDYVKNIMAYQAIYRWHLGRAPRLSASLERVPPLSETQQDE